MRFDILTIFPDLIYNYCSDSILGRAQAKKLIEIVAHNFRDYTLDKQKHVDDRPYGGGAGMLLQVQPIYDCLKSIGAICVSPSARYATSNDRGEGVRGSGRKKIKIIILDPAGKKFDQRMAEKFAKLDRLILICGRYEGFDERIYKFVDEKVSVGDYVLAGGELPALTIAEAVSRLIPGVLGNEESLANETFTKRCRPELVSGSDLTSDEIPKQIRDDSLAEYPQYTRPENFMGMKVPKVLLSGDHGKIEEWRKKKSFLPPCGR